MSGGGQVIAAVGKSLLPQSGLDAYLSSMIAQQEIHRLPFREKLALLEAVWAEISSEPEKIEPPQWHRDILDERDRALQQGREQVLDWDEAKKQIERAIR